MYLPQEARFPHLLALPEGENIGKAINDAMKAVEAANEDLRDVLPKTYTHLANRSLVELLKLIEDRAVDVMAAVGPNFFYTVTLPCTLWFLDRGKRGTDHEDKVLFIDARHVFRQIDRAHRDFTPEQLEFLASTSTA